MKRECPLCGDAGEGGSWLPAHIREECGAVDDLLADLDAMTPGSTLPTSRESSRQSAQTQGKQGTRGTSLSTPGPRCHPGDFTSDTLNRALSTDVEDKEASAK